MRGFVKYGTAGSGIVDYIHPGFSNNLSRIFLNIDFIYLFIYTVHAGAKYFLHHAYNTIAYSV